MTFGPLAFAAPGLLLALIALPILWLLLRAIPPAPIRRRFPAVALMLGLKDEDRQADKTPWWLLLLRMLAVAAAIIGFAGPVLNPDAREPGTGPMLVLLDGSWADARDWPRAQARAAAALEEAARAGNKPVWDVVETWLKSRPNGRVTARKINTPRLVGMAGNPGLA